MVEELSSSCFVLGVCHQWGQCDEFGKSGWLKGKNQAKSYSSFRVVYLSIVCTNLFLFC